MDKRSFSQVLISELQKPLPGRTAQMYMGVTHHSATDLPAAPGKNTRMAAVLILLYPGNGSVNTIFIKRPEYDGVHGGQIGFPGGRMEPGDNDLIRTALREASEEVGTEPEKVHVTGTLTPLFIPVSDMLVTPVVGWIDEKPEFRCLDGEVVFVIEGNLQKLLDRSIVKEKKMLVRGELLTAKYFDYKGYVIWGATAMMLHELLEVIRGSELINPDH